MDLYALFTELSICWYLKHSKDIDLKVEKIKKKFKRLGWWSEEQL